MSNLLKKYLYRTIYLPTKFSGKVENFESLFKCAPDPWNYENSSWERKRFDTLLNFVKETNPNRILELGCGEGFFTEMLSEICEDVMAVDISKSALERARKRVPEVKFFLEDFTKDDFDPENKNFDIVVASEILYYLKKQDIRSLLNNINSRYLLTSNFWVFSSRLDRITMETGYRKLKTKWLFSIDDFQIKASKICLWERL